MADAVEDARPLEGLQPKLTEQTGVAKDNIHTSPTTTLDALTQTMVPHDDCIQTAQDLAQSRLLTANEYRLRELWFNARPGDIVLAAKRGADTFRKAMVISVDLSSEMENLIYFHAHVDYVNYSDVCHMVSFGRLMRWANPGSEHLLGNGLSGYSDRQNASTVTVRPGTTGNQDFEATQLSMPSNKEAGATVGDPNVAILSNNLHYSDIQLTGAELHHQYGHLGHMEYVISSGTRQHTHASPGATFDELEAPVVSTDDYGLSDRDGYEMG
jgi:hypothetical protein